jgi:methylase of polypeptide subunit release factors
MEKIQARHNVDRNVARFGVADPPELCELVASSIPADVLKKANRILDAGQGCCGISKAIVNRMVNELDIPFFDAILRVYGVDNDLALTNRAKRLGFRTVCSSYLEWEPDMQFDVIVGNPPFQEVTDGGRKDQASNLWTKFWIHSLELAKPDGVVSLITPTSWLSPSANLRGKFRHSGKNRLWDVFNQYGSVAQVEGVDTYFRGVGSSFGIVTVDKSKSDGLHFVEGYSPDLGFLPKSGTAEVLANVGSGSTLGTNFHVSQNPGSGWRVSVPLSRKVTEKSVEVLKDEEVPQSGSSNTGLFLYLKVKNETEAKKVRNVVISAADILNVHCRWSGFMNIQIFKMLNYPKGR